jgi:hypothetical protein
LSVRSAADVSLGCSRLPRALLGGEPAPTLRIQALMRPGIFYTREGEGPRPYPAGERIEHAGRSRRHILPLFPAALPQATRPPSARRAARQVRQFRRHSPQATYKRRLSKRDFCIKFGYKCATLGASSSYPRSFCPPPAPGVNSSRCSTCRQTRWHETPPKRLAGCRAKHSHRISKAARVAGLRSFRVLGITAPHNLNR